MSETHYISELPNLINEWDWEKNSQINLFPDNLLSGSNKIAWWKCALGHEWNARIIERARNNTGCPYCANRKIQVGFNDLSTTDPELAKEWHPQKNVNITPYEVTKGSSKKVWWLCVNGHEWEACIASRANGRGCPFCANNKILADFNDLATTHPILVNEWNYEKNKSLSPNAVLAGSSKKVWWKCKNGHEWQSPPNNRNKGVGCPRCSGRVPKIGVNDLATVNPALAKEWHPTLNAPMLPNEFLPKSSKKVWWLCPRCGHEWQAFISNRSKGAGCPCCSGQVAKIGVNDLATVNPTLAKEWHPTKNEPLKPDTVLPNCSKKVWWKCPECAHEWQATVSSRSNKRGCPNCYKIKIRLIT